MTGSTPPHPVLEKYYPSDADRQSFVGALFDGAARHYNRIGTMLDLGSGPWYRRRVLRRAGLRPGMRLLDVATGTGLVARGAVRTLGDPGRVIGVDSSCALLQDALEGLRLDWPAPDFDVANELRRLEASHPVASRTSATAT